MAEQQDRLAAMAKLWELIKGTKVAMMTSWTGERLRSRPMQGYQDEFAGELFFFTKLNSGKTEEVDRFDQINLAYVDPSKQNYVSVCGKGTISTDREPMKQYWNKHIAAWFPQGLEDPDLGLIRVEVEDAEYWDGTTSSMKYLWEVSRANMTGRAPDVGDHAAVKVR